MRDADRITATFEGSAVGVVKQALKHELSRSWIVGFIWGVIFMATLDIGDIHICTGECDGSGYDIVGPRK